MSLLFARAVIFMAFLIFSLPFYILWNCCPFCLPLLALITILLLLGFGLVVQMPRRYSCSKLGQRKQVVRKGRRWADITDVQVATVMYGISHKPDSWLASGYFLRTSLWGMVVDSFYGKQEIRDRLLLRNWFTRPKSTLKIKFYELIGLPLGKLPTPLACSSPKSASTLYCFCRSGASGDMVECTKCNEWYHCNCIRVDVRSVAKDNNFKCPKCQDNSWLKFPTVILVERSIPTVDFSAILAPCDVQHLNFTPPNSENHLQQTFPQPDSSFADELKENCICPVTTSTSSCRDNNPPVLQLASTSPGAPCKTMLSIQSAGNSDYICDLGEDLSPHFDVKSPQVTSSGSEYHDETDHSDFCTTRKQSSCGTTSNKFKESDITRTTSFEINNMDWNRFLKTDGKIVSLLRGWTDLVNDAFAIHNNICVLRFEKRRFNPTSHLSYLYAQGRCKHPDCMKFILKCKSYDPLEPLRFNMRCFGTTQHHDGDMFARKVQNFKRTAIKDKLKFRTASAVATEMHANADMEAIRCGNENTRPERKLFRKMKYEKMKECDNHLDPMWDLELERRRESKTDDRFIRVLSICPFHVVTFSDAQLRILRLLHANRFAVIAHIDATGTLIQEIPDLDGSSKTLMYAITVAHPFPGFPPLALCEFITNDHTAPSITKCLKSYVEKANTGPLKSKVLFSRIETDFSLALIYAAIDAFGPSLKIREYLNICFEEIWSDRAPLKTNFHVCRAHMMKTFVHELKIHFKADTSVIPDLKYLLQQYLQSKTMHEILFYVRKILFLCLSESQSGSLTNELVTLRSLPLLSNLDDNACNHVEILVRAHSSSTKDAIYKSTCFGIVCNDLAILVLHDMPIGDPTKPNTFHNPTFVQYLLKDIFPYTPLLTHVMFDIRSDSHNLDHQWPAENWNRTIKVSEQRDGRTKVGRYVRASKEMFKGRCNDFEASLLKQIGIRAKILKPGSKQYKTPKLPKQNVTPKLSTTRMKPPTVRPSCTRKRLFDSTSYRVLDESEVQECWDRKGKQVAIPHSCSNSFERLPFVLWSSRAIDLPRYEFQNSCPLDNCLVTLTFLMETYSYIRNFFQRPDLPDPATTTAITDCIDFVRRFQFNHAKKHWLMYVSKNVEFQRQVKAAEIEMQYEIDHPSERKWCEDTLVSFDMYGSECEYVLQPLREFFTMFDEITSCEVHTDVRVPTSPTVFNKCTVRSIISDLNGETGIRRKCAIPGCLSNMSSRRVCSQEKYAPVPVICLGPTKTVYEEVPDLVNISGTTYKLAAVSLFQRHRCHFVTVFPHERGLFMYDGMARNNKFEKLKSPPMHQSVSLVYYRLATGCNE